MRRSDRNVLLKELFDTWNPVTKQPARPKRHASIVHFGESYSAHSLLVILVLLISFDGGLGNTVQITLTGLGNPAAALLLILLENPNLLEGLHDLAVNGAGSIDVVRRARTTVLGATVHLPQAADTDSLAHIDVASDGCGADVVPEQSQQQQLV